MENEAIEKVKQLESASFNFPQIEIATQHILHSGVYVRTIVIPPNVTITGALVKIPTTLILAGSVIVYTGEETKELNGYNTLVAFPNRKQAFFAKSETHLSMVFASNAKTVHEAEAEFTDEVDKLLSNNTIIITGK